MKKKSNNISFSHTGVEIFIFYLLIIIKSMFAKKHGQIKIFQLINQICYKRKLTTYKKVYNNYLEQFLNKYYYYYYQPTSYYFFLSKRM